VANIHLPQRAQPWRDGRRALAGRGDLRIVTQSAAGLVLEVGSGRYDFIQGFST
jgi:hypothetical protein